jgi:hypothetical protein
MEATMSWTTPTPTIALVAPLALLLVACPGDDGSADTEGTTGTSTGADSTDGGPGPDPDTTTTGVSATGSTTEALDDTGTSTTGDDTTGEPPPAGTCVGLDQVGNIASVLSRDGMPIDTTCDPDPAACGGDPVGSWSLEATCGFEAFPNPFETDCPGSTFAIEILSQSGTMTFVDDGTFVQDFDIQSQLVVDLDVMACFGIDCTNFEMALQMDSPAATCAAMGPTCSCTIPDDGMPEQVMGTYEVMGNDLVLTTVDGSQALPFCIGSDRLDLWQALYATPVITDAVCADPQDCADALGDMYDVYLCMPK